MPHYLAAGYLPDDFDPSLQTEATVRDITAANEELEAAGARILALGLSGASNAKSLRAQPDGKVLITDRPYLETKEHVGGLSILEAANLDEALAWARKGALACRVPVEVRGRPRCLEWEETGQFRADQQCHGAAIGVHHWPSFLAQIGSHEPTSVRGECIGTRHHRETGGGAG